MKHDQLHPARLLDPELDQESFERILARTEEDPQLSDELDLVSDLTTLFEGANSKAAAVSRRAEPARTDAPVATARPPGPQGPPGPSGPPAYPAEPVLAWSVRAALIAAAAVLVALFAPWGVETDDLQRWFAPPAFVQHGLRSGEGPGEAGPGSELGHAMIPYGTSDWIDARARLTELVARRPELTPARFWLACTRIELGTAEELALAHAELEQLAAGTGGVLAEHARWRQVVALDRMAARDEALALAGEIVAGEGRFAEAARLYLARRSPSPTTTPQTSR